MNASVITCTTRRPSTLFSATQKIPAMQGGCCHCMYSQWMSDQGLFRLSPLQLKNTFNASRCLSAGCCGTACTASGLCLSVLQLKANVNDECNCWSLHVRPVASFTCLLSNCKKNLQCLEVAAIVYRTKAIGSLGLFFDRKNTSTADASVITCATCGAYACLLWSSKEYLQCKQVVVTASTTRVFFLFVLQLKANVNSECKCRHCMYDPWLA